MLTGCGVAAALALGVDYTIGWGEWAIRRRRKLLAWSALGLIGAVMIASLAPLVAAMAGGGARQTVIIGAKGFSEQYILSRLIGARLEAAGYSVDYRDGLGSAVVFGALSHGDIDISVDYAGTIWTNEMKRSDTLPRPAMLAAISDWARRSTGARIIGGLGFENAYAFAVKPATARRYALVSLADLARAAPQLIMGTDPEFLERPEWRSVRSVYGIAFKATRSFSPSFMYNALASDQADVITAYTSDGRVAADGLVVLSDPRQAIPGYDAMLMVNARRAGDARLLAVLRPLIGTISVEAMRAANYRVDREQDKQSPTEAARWLEQEIAG